MIAASLLCGPAHANGLRVLDRAARWYVAKHRNAMLAPVTTQFEPCLRPNAQGIAVFSMCPAAAHGEQRKPASKSKSESSSKRPSTRPAQKR